MMKKMLAGVLALTTVLGMSTTAFATIISTPGETGIYGAEFEITNTVQLPTISIEVPADGAMELALNPYQIEVGNDKSRDQLVFAEQEITNGSDVPVAVNASLKGTASENSGVVFATAKLDPAKPLATKSVFAYLEIIDGKEGTAYADGYSTTAKNQLLLGKEAKKDEMIVMADKTAADKTNIAKFKIAGQVNAKPAAAWDETKDTFKTELKFTFTPKLAVVTAPVETPDP